MKQLSVFILIVSAILLQSAIYLNANAQVEISWQKTFGGTGEDDLQSITKTLDGGYICGGISNSPISGEKSENSIGFPDYWVVKLDSARNISWQTDLGCLNSNYMKSVIQTADGGYLCGGYSNSDSCDDKSENSIPVPFCYLCISNDYWIVKLDANGNIEWDNTIGAGSNDFLFAIEATADGGFILGGTSNSMPGNDKTGYVSGYDFWVVKLNGNGNIEWQNTIGGGMDDWLYSIKQTSDSGYILGGVSNSDIGSDKSADCRGQYDYWVVKLNQAGVVQWDQTIGGNDDDRLYAIDEKSDGSFICAGYSTSGISGDKNEANRGLKDCWIVNLDASGVITWQKTFGGDLNDGLETISATADSGFICAGYSKSPVSGDKMEYNRGFSDGLILKFDSGGNLQWQKTIGGYSSEVINSVFEEPDGTFTFGTSSASPLSGEKGELCRGGLDFWIFNVTTEYNTISGTVYGDLNGNDVMDAGEMVVSNKMVQEAITGRIAFTGPNGNYSLAVLDTGNFNISSIPIPYYNVSPPDYNIHFNATLLEDSLNNFALQPSGTYSDLSVKISPVGLFRAGMNGHYVIHYENKGTTSLSPTITLFPDSLVYFQTADLTPSAVYTDSVIWILGLLEPLQSGTIHIVVIVNSTTSIGTLINSQATITPLIGDDDPASNHTSWEIYTTGSMDPNDILVNRNTIFTTEMVDPPYLEYIIRFQNTGNDTAFNVRIENCLPVNLNFNTFEYVNASHPVQMEYVPGSRLIQFIYPDILLPDSNVNESASHGFIHYRIKPVTSLIAGDSILNTGAIYFDFNAPVITNTAVTEIILPTGINTIEKKNSFNFYPNPVSNELSVSYFVKNHSKVKLELIDLPGQQLQTFFENIMSEGEYKQSISLESLANGIYIIKFSVDDEQFYGKLIKQ